MLKPDKNVKTARNREKKKRKGVHTLRYEGNIGNFSTQLNYSMFYDHPDHVFNHNNGKVNANSNTKSQH